MCYRLYDVTTQNTLSLLEAEILHKTCCPVLSHGKRDRFVGLSVDRRIILKWIKNRMDDLWTGSMWLRIWTSGGFFLKTVKDLNVP
jgi:hypothetical protein